MSAVEVAPLPPAALLQSYVKSGAYTDCYSLTLSRTVTLTEFMAAFYTTPIFRLERWLLARFLGLRSTEQEALALANGELKVFSAWHVEARGTNQALLAAGRTRSWLMVESSEPGPSVATKLLFGSAVVQSRRGGLGWQFSVLLSFHKLYSRMLLKAAGRRLQNERS